MSATNEIIIAPGRSLRHYWQDLWQYRELFYFLSWRDFLVRYKQTVLGVAWSILRPLGPLLVFTVVFGKLVQVPTGGVPYPLLVFAGLLPWQFFASTLTEASNSLLSNTAILTKVYFPRLIVPASSVIVGLVDFLIAFILFLGLMLWYQFPPDWRILTLPLFFLLAMLAAFGLGLWFAALNVTYRDFRHIVPFIVQFGLYISPVGFSSAIVPEQFRLLYSLNPMVGVIDGFRWALLGQGGELYWPGLLLSILLTLGILTSGLWYFRKAERTFADLI